MNIRRNMLYSLILGMVITGPAMSQPSFTIQQLPNTLYPKDGIVWVGSDGTMLADSFPPGFQGESQCAQYKNGTWAILATPGFLCWVHGVNSSGQFAGTFGLLQWSSQPIYPYENLNGTFVPLQPPGLIYGAATSSDCSEGCVAFTTATALDINDAGHVLGDVYPATGGGWPTGFVYSGGQYRMLAANGNGIAMNENDDVAGVLGTAIQHPAIFYHDGSKKDLGTLGGTNGAAYAINASDQVTGCADTTTLYQITNPVNSVPPAPMETCQAFLYDGTTMSQIQINGANWGSAGNSINDSGDVIGYYETDFNAPSLGFYYHAGQSYLLSNLVVNPPAGLVLTGGTFFRGSNQILASGSLPGNSSANFLLTPASGGAATPSITSVVNGASFAPNISGGSWITILGGSLSATTRPWASSDFVGDNLPTNLNGVSVTVNGIAAYPAYISPTQINVLAPNDANPGKMMVQVTNSAGSSSAFPMLENAVAPGLFQINSTYAAARHADGTLVAPAGSIAGVTSSPATPGETIELFGTGFGPTSPVVPDGQMVGTAVPLADPATVTIGGAPAVVTYAGMISVGLIQLNVTIPMSAKAGNESIEAKVGDVTTPSGLFLNIGN